MPTAAHHWVETFIQTIQTMTQPLYKLFQDDRSDTSYDLALSILHPEDEDKFPLTHPETMETLHQEKAG